MSPGVRAARHRDSAAEAFHDVLRDRQTEAGAAAFGGEVWIEDVRHVLRRDAHAAIGDGNRDAIGGARGTQRDERRAARATLRHHSPRGGR